MAGVRGRSGRKSWNKEQDAHYLWDLSIPILKDALTSKTTPKQIKRDIALELIKKMLPQHVEAHGEFNVTYPPDWQPVDAVVGVRVGSNGSAESATPDATSGHGVGR